MLKRLQWVIFPLLALLSASCYGKAEIEAPGVFTCQTNDDCLPEFECRNDPGQPTAGKFCMKRETSVPGDEPCIDSDQDGFGSSATSSKGFQNCGACKNPTAYSAGNLNPGEVCSGKVVDCDDANPDTRPGAQEFCDGMDNDCDGTKDNIKDVPCTENTQCNGGAPTRVVNGVSVRLSCGSSSHKCEVTSSTTGKALICNSSTGKYEESP